MKVNNKPKLSKKVNKFDELEKEIPKTAEFIENKRINIIKVPKDKKKPNIKAWQEKQYTVNQLKKHHGNFGVHVGFYHDSGSSIAVVDIDGFKYKKMSEKLKKMAPNDRIKHLDTLNDEELDKLCQESKDYLLNLLVDLFPSPMVSKSASGGYHIFIFNETLQTKPDYASGRLQHYISQNLKFSENCRIEELRGLHLMDSLEIFTQRGRQVILPGSFVDEDGTTGDYKRIDGSKVANSWDTIGTVEDLAKTVKEGLMAKGLEWEPIDEIPTEQPPTQETSYNNRSNYNNTYVNNNTDLIESDQIEEKEITYLSKKVGTLYEMTKDKKYHNTLGISLSHGLKTQGLSHTAILRIIKMGLLRKHEEHWTEHFKQVEADLKSTTVKKTGFPTILNDYPELEPLIVDIKGKIREIKTRLEKGKKARKQEKAAQDLDDLVELRKNPSKLINKANALAFEEKIKEEGLINWLESRLHAIMLGDLKNVYRKTLAGFNVARGFDGYFFATEGDAGVGKSMEDETVLNELIPDIYVIKKNAPSYAAVTRNAYKHEEYYNRTLLYIGDIGREEEIKEFMEIARVYRNLITEHKFIKENADNDPHSTIEYPLQAESCACVYSTTKYSKDVDNQLRSRTINSTPKYVDEESIMNFQAFLEVSTSPQSKAKEKALQELEQFRDYFIYKTLDKREIVNPWGTIFKRFSEAADVSVRENKQLRGLFNAYCVLTSYECKRLKSGKLLASEKQLTDFFKLIALDSSMIPHIYNLLMLLITGQKNQRNIKKSYNMVMLDVENATDDYSDLNKYVNDILEQINRENSDYGSWEEGQESLLMDRPGVVNKVNELNKGLRELFINRLMNKYQFKPKNGGVFFTINHITNGFHYQRAVKDIDDMQAVLYELFKDGYIGKLEQKYNKKNVYYLTKKCEELGQPFKITEEDREAREQYLSDINEVEETS